MNDAQLSEAMGAIRVETYGGAATQYMNGPRYLHLNNMLDPVAFLWGSAPGPSRLLGLVRRGQNSDHHLFAKVVLPKRLREKETFLELVGGIVDRTVHNPRRIYFEERDKLKELGRTLF